MSKLKEIVYICLDQIKASTDDSYVTEDHVIYLAEKFRALFLAKQYKDIRKQLPESNYQTICLPLETSSDFQDMPCIGESHLRSVSPVPTLLPIGVSSVFPLSFFQGEITLISKERMKYVGHNKYLKNIIYCAIGPQGYLEFKSSNPQHKSLTQVNLTGVFENCIAASKFKCETNCEDADNRNCNPMDQEFPLEEPLVAALIEAIVKTLSPVQYRPEDNANNAKDDMGDLANFMRNNSKSQLAKTLD